MQRIIDAQVRQAEIDGSNGIAYDIAQDELDALSPADGVERVLAEADGDLVLYDALALHWICSGIVERRLTLHVVGWVADRFEDARDFRRWDEAASALRRWVE